jgi:hypothetical protein
VVALVAGVEVLAVGVEVPRDAHGWVVVPRSELDGDGIARGGRT